MEKGLEKTITLYPSNWLYNAGVIGLLRVLEFGKRTGKFQENMFYLNKDGSVDIVRVSLGKSYDCIVEYHKYHKSELNEDFKIWGKNKRYPNYIQPGQKEFFLNHYVPKLSLLSKIPNKKCTWCEGYFLPADTLRELKEIWDKMRSKNKDVEESFKKFMLQREVFQKIHMELGGAITEMPNSFWNMKFSTPICHLCSYLVIYHHLALTTLKDNSSIFINAPSFEIMWHLNEYARKIYGKEEVKEVRRILGMSLIEMARKLNVQLGRWTKMNIEVVSKYKVKIGEDKKGRPKYKDIIDFFVLPYEIVDILSDREIASLLNDIGEFKVLNMVLDGRFDKILEFGERIMRIGLKPRNEWGKHEKKFIEEEIKLSKNKDGDLLEFSNKLFKLYALIKEKTK